MGPITHVRESEIKTIVPHKTLLMACGWIAVGFGIAGAVLPLMPATPFFLLAAWCFARSSPRFHGWLIAHPVFGQIIAAYRERRGMTIRYKMLTLLSLWLAIGVSAYAVPVLWVRIALAAIAVGVTVHIVRMRTRTGPVDEETCSEGCPEA